jgi:hypothetical protein
MVVPLQSPIIQASKSNPILPFLFVRSFVSRSGRLVEHSLNRPPFTYSCIFIDRYSTFYHLSNRKKRDKMKINPAPLHLAQTILTAVVIIFSITILGTSAHTLDVFNKQQTSNPWWLPMWPQHFDVQGTKALIASSVVTLVLSISYRILVPQRESCPHRLQSLRVCVGNMLTKLVEPQAKTYPPRRTIPNHNTPLSSPLPY